jgi:tetratricopeptide (TPR) repeat protein
MRTVTKYIFWAAVLAAGSVCASGQDLGSSNKLFGNKPVASKPAETKAAPKKNTATPKRPAARTVRTPAPAKKAPSVARKPATTQAPKVIIEPVTPRQITIIAGTGNTESYEVLIDNANSARDRRDLATAERSYKTARESRPRDARAIFGLANIYSDQHRWEDAEEAYRAALAIEPNDAVTMIALSYVLTQPVPAPDLSGRYDEAEKLARTAVSLSPNNALAHDQLGVALEMKGLIGNEAEEAYRTALRLAPNFAPAHAHLGRILRRRGNSEASSAAYLEAIRLAKDVGTIIIVAEILQSEQRFNESELLLREVVDRDPKNPAALMLLGRALMTKGSFDEAEMLIRRSISSSPYPYAANILLASLYSRKGTWHHAEGALVQASRFVTPFEKKPLARQFEAVGDEYLRSRNNADAARAFRQAIQLDPENGAIAAKLNKVAK